MAAGTLVTLESFSKWRNDFAAQQAEEKAELLAARARERKSELTGTLCLHCRGVALLIVCVGVA